MASAQADDGLSQLAKVQSDVAAELERGMDALVGTAVARLEALAARLDRLDSTMTSLHGDADRLSESRRHAAQLRSQMHQTRRDLMLAEALYRDTAAAPLGDA